MKYQPKLARTFIAFALIGCLSITEATAQETCSLDDVSDALNQLPCVADGVYLSPDSAANAVADICFDADSEEGCHQCFNRGRRKLLLGFKAIAKIGMIGRKSISDLRNALDNAEDNTCYYDDYNDYPWDSSAQTAATKTKTKTKPKRSRGSASEKAPSTTPRNLVESICSCNTERWRASGGHTGFLACAETVTQILVRHEKLTEQRATDLREQLQRSQCGN